jgi:hypothetical protein
MTITAKLPDGTELNFPDGTDTAVIQRTVKSVLAQSQPEVVATTSDGGKITKDAGGALSFSSPAYSTNDPAKVAEIMKGATPASQSMASFDQSTLAQYPIAAASAKAMQGVPFVGQWADEAVGMMGGQPAQNAMRAAQGAMDRQNPGTATALQIGGGIVGAVPMVLAAGPSLIGQGVSTAGKMLAGGLTGFVAGGTEGAVSGAGAANNGDRAQGALSGGITGAALGGGIGALAPVIASAFKAGSRQVIDYLKQTDISGIKQALGISSDAARIIKAHLGSDDIAAAQAAMDKAGPEAMIADSSPQASQLLDTTVAAGGPAQRIARDAVDSRAAAASDKLKTAMDSALGPAPEGIKTATRDIATRTATTRAAAYDAAYASPINYAAPEGQAIEAVVARIPTRTFNSAVQEANDAMKAAGVKNMQIMASIDTATGKVTFTKPPNVQQLDFLKRSLDQIARDATDPITGKVSGEGARAAGLAADLRRAVSDAVPDYARAVKLGGDKIAEENALKIGRDLLKPGTTREDVAQAMLNASVESRIGAKRGLRLAFSDAMDEVKAVASDANLDARAAIEIVKKFSSKSVRDKAIFVIGKAQAEKLFEAFDQAATQLALRTAVARNSATAARTAGKQAMDAIIESPMQQFKRGEVAKGTRGLIQIMTKSTSADQIAAQQKIYAEVARALTEAKGSQAKAALAIVQQAINGAPISAAKAEFVAKAVTATLGGGAYLAGSQAQTRAQNAQ